MTEYKDLPISEELRQAVAEMGFTHLTEIQEKAIPVMLEGREIIAKAPTGTGKTCAFGIPIIEKLDPASKELQALILCPTRELCTQICEDLRDLAKFKPGLQVVSVYGGQPMGKQLAALGRKPQVVVATPGRLLDHMGRRTIRLNKVSTVVLDEADEMLNMGFFKDVRKILDALPKQKQMVMFSATISREVMDIGWLYQRDAEEITIQPVELSRPKITQYSYEVTGRKKIAVMAGLIKKQGYGRVLIFCNTKYATTSLCEQLAAYGLETECLNGDMIQSARNKIMARYKAGEIGILIATDVAARGIDVEDIDVVFNFDVPQDNESYTHRIGRTGRAQREGVAYIFYSPDERQRLKNIIRYTRNDIRPIIADEEGNITLEQPN
ncbi:MAG: DEAD/DEAH box helicase [Angelakisella sp.]|nr:DEAD/DEAH box helicase [Angelakisella sp.]